jgi:hypothetical protein
VEKKGSVGFQKISSVIITKKDEKNKTKGGKSASIHFFIFLGIFSSVSVCEIASRSDQLAPVMYGQYRLLNKRSNPIRSKNYAKKQENHKITNSTTLNQNHPRKKKRRHCSHQRQAPAAPRSWRLGERPTVRRKEDVVAEALTEGVASTVPEKTMMSLRRGRRRLGGGRRL